jgi:hypothetical protein
MHSISFVTTNYDRAIELAANAEGLSLDDGFGELNDSESATWTGFDPSAVGGTLVKLHGSTDWFADQSTGQPSKLRHPMPLFGRGTLRLPRGDILGSALVLPSREKLLSRPPYPRLSQAFLNACDRCDAAVFIGTSMRDPHVKDAARTIAINRPVFAVSRQGSVFDIPGVRGIAQPGSDFLISTLPAALSSPNPVQVLETHSGQSSRYTTGILEHLRIALDEHQSANRRCEAIEVLASHAVSLAGHLIHQLLGGDSPVVARYALGLITTSHAGNELLESARQCLHASEPLFGEELGLLEMMIGTKPLS